MPPMDLVLCAGVQVRAELTTFLPQSDEEVKCCNKNKAFVTNDALESILYELKRKDSDTVFNLKITAI